MRRPATRTLRASMKIPRPPDQRCTDAPEAAPCRKLLKICCSLIIAWPLRDERESSSRPVSGLSPRLCPTGCVAVLSSTGLARRRNNERRVEIPAGGYCPSSIQRIRLLHVAGLFVLRGSAICCSVGRHAMRSPRLRAMVWSDRPPARFWRPGIPLHAAPHRRTQPVSTSSSAVS